MSQFFLIYENLEYRTTREKQGTAAHQSKGIDMSWK